MKFEFKDQLKVWQGDNPWYFLVLPTAYTQPIEQSQPLRRGFGAVKVQPTIGDTTWETSVFPDSERGAYLLFVKQQVRKAEGIELGDMCHVELSVLSV